MDMVLVALGVSVPLVVALAWAVSFLIAQCRHRRRRAVPTSHVFRGQGEAVTVAELLEDAIEHGGGLRLNWSEEDEAKAHSRWPGIRPYAQDQMGTGVMERPSGFDGEFPTEILPRVEGTGH